MSLTAGTRLGPYEIQSAIGAGGMGEVYKARDTRLDRTVAIKVLPPDVSADPDRRARFEREAKTVAGLNHAHICTLHDVGDHDGAMFLVMEHLAGQTLAERLEKGPLPLEQALTIATEIADALSAAHRQGVIHRDLKPANVMLTKGGAKLLDFGLAKLTGHGEQPAATHAVSAVPTQAATLTGQGVIVGTLQYMAPEQLEGKPPDARTDLWALGAILYEMVTGKRAFEGMSVVSVMSAIMEREPPPIASLQPLTPPALDRLARRCLAKSPDDRPDTAHDVADELRNVDPSSKGSAAGRTGWLSWRNVGIATACLGVGVIIDAVLGGLFRGPAAPSPQPPQRATFGVALPANDGFTIRTFGVAIAPDSSRLAFVASHNGVRQLFLRSLDGLDVQRLAGTEDAELPAFSPDGHWLAFFAGGWLRKVRVTGGPVLPICETGYRRGVTWTDNDTLVFASSLSKGLMRVSATSGGAPTPLTGIPDEAHYIWPDALPNGRAVLFTEAAQLEDVTQMELAVFDLSSREKRVLLPGSSPHFGPPGVVTFVRNGGLWGVAFDPRRLEVVGDPARTADTPITHGSGLAEYGVGHDGTLAYRTDNGGGELTWVDGSGRQTRIDERSGFHTPRLSADGRRIVSVCGGPSQEMSAICVYDVALGTLTKVTTPDTDTNHPSWAPGGGQIMFDRHRAIYTVPADGAAVPVRLSPLGRREEAGFWLPDGLTRIYHDPLGVWMQPPGGPAVHIVSTWAGELNHTELSPNRQWLAFLVGGQGHYAVYVQRFPIGARQCVSVTPVDGSPRWSSNGQELFYVSKGQMVSVPVDPKSGMWARPHVLFDATAFAPNFDVDAQGRFLMTTSQNGQLVVRLNWFEELKAKVAPAR